MVEIAEQLVKKKADFVLALKGNQRHLFEDTTDAFSTRQSHKLHLEQEKGHGRIDKRSYKVLLAEGNLTDEVARRWSMIRSLVRVEHEVTKPNTQPTKEMRYYISSLDFNEVSAKEIAYYIREHWGIENRLHWQLDVTFREDACRARKNFSARNLNLIRKLFSANSMTISRSRRDAGNAACASTTSNKYSDFDAGALIPLASFCFDTLQNGYFCSEQACQV